MVPCCPGGRDEIYFASELGHTHVPRFTRSHHVRGIREVGGSGKARGLEVTLVWTTTGCNSGLSPALLLRCASIAHVLAHPFAEIRPQTCLVLFFSGGGFSLPPRPDYFSFLHALQKDVCAVLGDVSIAMLEYCEFGTHRPSSLYNIPSIC
jgi:hypothetical protein